MNEEQKFPNFPSAIHHISDVREALASIALHTGGDEQRYNELSKPYRETITLCSKMEADSKARKPLEVLKKANQILSIFPALFEALCARADSYFILEDYRNALSAYNELLRNHPNSSDIHYQMGRCNFELGDIDAATREFELEMQISGEAPDIYLQLGGLQMSRGKSTYLHLYQNKEIHDPKKLYQACGKYYERAIQYFQRGLKVAPQNKELQELLESANSILNKMR